MVDFSLLALPFFQRALFIGIITGVLMAIFGVIIVLRRIAFFSDAIGHTALTGLALGLLLHIQPFLAALVFALLMAVAIAALNKSTALPFDTLLAVLFSASLALGVVLIQLTPGYQANLIGFLFGDILTVSTLDLYLSIILAAVSLLTLLFAGKKFITIALNPDLAHAEGIPVNRYELLFLLVLAALIALSIKMVGIVLITAMLIIPAASALNISPNLKLSFVYSVIISLISVIAGMFLSSTLNTTSGPTIVLVTTAFFALTLVLRPLVRPN